MENAEKECKGDTRIMRKKIRWTFMFNNRIAPCNFSVVRVLVTHEENGFSYCVVLNDDDTPTSDFSEIANKYLFKTKEKAIDRVYTWFDSIMKYLAFLPRKEMDGSGCILYLDGISSTYNQ